MTEAVQPSDGVTPLPQAWLALASDAQWMEAPFRDLLESMPDGIVMVDATGCIVMANSQAERLFDYGPGALCGCSVDTLLPARYRTAHAGHRDTYFRQPRKRAMGSGLDLWGLRRDGTEFPIEISLSPLRTRDQAFVLSAIRDVSERRRIERALQDKNDELARANEAKDRFLASVSHELRTPLNAIIGFTGTLLMQLPGPLNEEQAHQLRTVQRSGRHLLALINDLLDVARIASGKIVAQWETVDLVAVAEDVAQTLRQQAMARGLDLVVKGRSAPAEVITDRRMLNQILLNLVGNAVKFTEVGGVRMEVETDSPRWQVRVIDTGIGIAEADQARLFAAFSRVQSAAARRQEGAGLGLHLSQQLAQVLGAHITLHSAPGVGSTLTLQWPAPTREA